MWPNVWEASLVEKVWPTAEGIGAAIDRQRDTLFAQGHDTHGLLQRRQRIRHGLGH
jgi:hypothetical protein